METAQSVKAMERLEQEIRQLRKCLQELEQEREAMLLHMPPPMDKIQRDLPSFEVGEK